MLGRRGTATRYPETSCSSPSSHAQISETNHYQRASEGLNPPTVMPPADPAFPHELTICIPFPTHRLANSALLALSVDQELSPLVRRSFSLTTASSAPASSATKLANYPSKASTQPQQHANPETKTVLQTNYAATTPRMLRVAVNGFFETVGVIIGVMQELDTDVLHEFGIEGLEGAQGVEWGLMGVGTGGSTKVAGQGHRGG